VRKVVGGGGGGGGGGEANREAKNDLSITTGAKRTAHNSGRKPAGTQRRKPAALSAIV